MENDILQVPQVIPSLERSIFNVFEGVSLDGKD